MTKATVVGSLLALSLAGCSDEPRHSGEAADAGGRQPPGASDGGTVGQGDGDAEGPGDADDAGEGVDASRADAGLTVADLQPLEVGSYWRYTDECEFPTSEVTAAGTYFGHAGAALQQVCEVRGYLTYYAKTERGVETHGEKEGNPWTLALGAPLADGASWTYLDGEAATGHWKHIPRIEVPAGVFTDCWERSFTEFFYEAPVTTFCPGVGVVQSDRQSFVLKLVEYRIGP